MTYLNNHHYSQPPQKSPNLLDSPVSTIPTILYRENNQNQHKGEQHHHHHHHHVHNPTQYTDTYGVGDAIGLVSSVSQRQQQQQQQSDLPLTAAGHRLQRMDHPDKSGPESHRKRSAASSSSSSSRQQQQQQQPQDPNTISAPRRRASAQDRYLAAVSAGGSSSTTQQQQQQQGSAAYQSQQQQRQQQPPPQPQHHQQQPLPPAYSVATSASSSSLGQPPPFNTNNHNAATMPLGSVAAAAYPTDPYQHHRLPPQQHQQAPPLVFQQQHQQQQQAPAGYALPHHRSTATTTTQGQPPPPQQQQQYPYYAQQQAAPRQPPLQQQMQLQLPQPYASAPVAVYHEDPIMVQQQQQVAAAAGVAVIAGQPPLGRLPSERPLMKLSVSLIETYKHINTVYYEERDARRKALRAVDPSGGGGGSAGAGSSNKKGGANNNGWDDDNYDYIITANEVILGRYKIKERIGKGSFGQVVRAEDLETKREVAIKIIKSKKPFLMQAKTEIELLMHLWEKDVEDQHNIVRLLTHFMYRNHQCLVFEMLSLNLYELLKNTQFGGVSLNLIRKFAKQVLRALAFLARPNVDVIHCDLKPENILLRHPKKSGVKVIDFGSSCRSNKRMYSYIQSRFYRSPEVMLGLPYSVAIDMWSLGCILVEMHTGEPLFSGSDQFDQMQKIVKILGMLPSKMLDQSTDAVRCQFFDRKKGQREWTLRQTKPEGTGKDKAEKQQQQQPQEVIIPSTDPVGSLTEVITSGAQQKKKYPPSEAHNSQRNYELFVDLVYKMLAYNPEERIKPLEALEHAFLSEAPAAASARHG